MFKSVCNPKTCSNQSAIPKHIQIGLQNKTTLIYVQIGLQNAITLIYVQISLQCQNMFKSVCKAIVI